MPGAELRAPLGSPDPVATRSDADARVVKMLMQVRLSIAKATPCTMKHERTLWGRLRLDIAAENRRVLSLPRLPRATY
jgi:hypothetical protein